MKKTILTYLLALLPLAALSQTEPPQRSAVDTLTLVVRFPLGIGQFADSTAYNNASLRQLHDSLQQSITDSTLWRVQIGAFASPEGPTALNRRLVKQRAASLYQWTAQRFPLDPTVLVIDTAATLYDWATLSRIVAASSLQDKDEMLLDIHRARSTSNPDSTLIAQLRTVRQGRPWRWLQRYAFPQMRNAYARILTLIPAPSVPQAEERSERFATDIPRNIALPSLVPAYPAPRRPFYMGLRTNLLYDAALVPNLGVEFSLGHRWSLATNWAWAWWRRRSSHLYWRVFGGELNLRRWFGSRKPLTGHHLGVYGQVLTYDVLLSSHRGYLGGRPGHGMLCHPSWNIGAEYGYACPIARRWNLDFTLGLGYFWGNYYQYTAIDTHYVWQGTKQKRWLGPTKAEVSLVWLLGRGNENKK
jgi:hypothetical protein